MTDDRHLDDLGDDAEDDPFDDPSAWRLEAVRALGLSGTDAIAGANTGAGYPDALEPVVELFGRDTDVLVDVGAGLGATTAWLARRGSVGRAIAVEPAPRACALSSRAFPELVAVCGEAAAVPLRPLGRVGVSLLGVVSLVEDLHDVLAEATRVAGPGGRIAIADLCATRRDVWHDPDGPNTFWSLDAIADTLRGLGWTIAETRTRPADAPTAWSAVSERVDDVIAARHADDDGYATWRDDRQHLGELIAAHRLEVGTITATRPAAQPH